MRTTKAESEMRCQYSTDGITKMCDANALYEITIGHPDDDCLKTYKWMGGYVVVLEGCELHTQMVRSQQDIVATCRECGTAAIVLRVRSLTNESSE